MPRSLVDHPAQLLSMGKRLMAVGRAAEAAALVAQSLAQRPGDRLIAEIAAAIATHRVPGFHRSMLHDEPRNRAYRLGVEAAAAGRTVLDIGTGSGLLAMMAARAGAAHVFACEQDLRLARTAREIVAQNGLSEQVTVLHAHSGSLDRDRDLRGGADLVISEIFDANLLGEGVLSSLRHARQRLCLPGAQILPGHAAITGALVDIGPDPDGKDSGLSDIEGFDISLFRRHLRRDRSFASNDPRLQLRSAPADLFAFDFAEEIASEARGATTCTSLGGRVTGVLQWIAFDTGPGQSYANAPGPGARAHWGLRHFALDQPIETRPGDQLNVQCWRDDTTLLCWIED